MPYSEAGPGVYGDEEPWEKHERKEREQARRSLDMLDSAGPGVFSESEQNRIRWDAHKAGIRKY